MAYSLSQIFSTRELSLIIWIAIGLLIGLYSKSFRSLLKQLILTFLKSRILPVFLLFSIYTISLIYLFGMFHLWDITLLKDTIFWFISVALLLFFTINNAKNTGFFKKAFIETFKLTIVIEYIVNLYTFNLIVELMLFPILLIMFIIPVVTESNPNQKQLGEKIKSLSSFFGLIIFIIIIIKSVIEFNVLASINNIYSFLLPLIMTMLILAFLYFLALFINYEELWTRIKILYKYQDLYLKMKTPLFCVALFDINKLQRISKNLNKQEAYNANSIREYFRKISK